MILTHKYDLNVVPGGLPLLIRVSRNDTSSRLFTLFVGEGVLSVPASASAIFRNFNVSTAADVSVNRGITMVSVDLTKSMTNTIGLIQFEICPQNGGE